MAADAAKHLFEMGKRLEAVNQQILFQRIILDPRLDIVELGDPADRLGRQAGGLPGLGDLEKSSSRVRQTADFKHPAGRKQRFVDLRLNASRNVSLMRD